MDILSIDHTDPADYYSPSEQEEADYAAALAFDEWQAERYDPDNPYADLNPDDQWSLDCPHLSVSTEGKRIDCEDCNTRIR